MLKHITSQKLKINNSLGEKLIFSELKHDFQKNKS